jgi:hypothetical protein
MIRFAALSQEERTEGRAIRTIALVDGRGAWMASEGFWHEAAEAG